MIDVTIRDVAKIAGVSVATVSRVINNNIGVRQETIDKVQAAIAQTGYVPNTIAQNLKSDKTNIIGLIISNISNHHFTTMAQVIEKILREKGYSLIVSSTEDKPALECEILKRYMGLRVDGLIINTTNQNNQYIASLSQTIPTVLIERSINDTNFLGDTITSNNFSGMYSIVHHLLSCGHRNIGIINSSLQVSTGQERLKGFTAAMAEAGITVNKDYAYRFDCQYFNEEGGVKGCKHLMSLETPPSAIVVSNNTMAIGVYKYLHMCGYQVPDDVSVVSYGNIENSELFEITPSYTTHSPFFIGEKAAKHLLSRIEDPHKGNCEVIFEPSLVINKSIKSQYTPAV